MSRETQGEKKEGNSIKEQKMREGDWICAECDAHNYNARMTCYKCHLSKEASEVKSKGKSALDWECFECKASNFSWRDECFKCHITRFQSEELKARHVGLDWFCRFCDLKNFPNRFECFKCKKHRDLCDSRGPPPDMNRGPSPRRSPPRMGMRRSSPPRRGMSPNRRPMSPPRGRSPPRRGMSPPGRGRSPPRRPMSPPRRGRSPPRRHNMSPPPMRGRNSGARSPPQKRALSPSRSLDEWKCGLCSSMNGLRREHCYKCGTPQGNSGSGRSRGRQGPSGRSSQQGSSLLGQVFGPDEKRGGDWDCPECHVNNFHFRKQCFKCKIDKPVEIPETSNKAPDYRPDDYYEPESPPKRRRMNSDTGEDGKRNDARQQYGPDWVCKFCKVDIFPTRNDCYKCGAGRDECELVDPLLSVGGPGNNMHPGAPSGPMVPGPYSGPPVAQGYSCECGNFNRCDEPCCLQCGKPNDLLSGGPPQAEAPFPHPPAMDRCQPLPNVDWDCMECRVNNYHHRTNCFKCKKPREQCEDRSSWVGGFGDRHMSQGRDGRRGSRSPPRRSDRFDGPGGPGGRFSPPRSGGRYNSPPRGSGRFSPPRSSKFSPPPFNRGGGGRSPPRRGFSPQRRGRSPIRGNRSPQRDQEKDYKPDWQCKDCSINNFVKRQKCFRCGKDRSEVELVFNAQGKPIGPNDWLCPKCNGHNFSRRTDCYKCKTEKPDENRQRSGSHSGGRMQQHDDEEDLNMQGNIDKVEIDA